MLLAPFGTIVAGQGGEEGLGGVSANESMLGKLDTRVDVIRDATETTCIAPVQLGCVLDRLQAHGVHTDGFLRSMGLDPARVAEPHGAFPIALLDPFWQAAAAALEDDDFGLNTAEHVNACASRVAGPSPLDALAAASLTETTALVQPLECVIRLQKDRLGVTIEDPLMSARGSRHRTEFAVAMLVGLCRRSIAPNWALHRVCFKHPGPARLETHSKVFGIAPNFDQAECGFLLLQPALESLRAAFEQRQVSTTSLVERLLSSSTTQPAPSLAEAARKLAMAPRSLQRRLRAEGTTYRVVVDRALAQRAVRLLSDDTAPIMRVAIELGFSEPRSFHRAFKRWTGRAPGAFRLLAPHAAPARVG